MYFKHIGNLVFFVFFYCLNELIKFSLYDFLKKKIYFYKIFEKKKERRVRRNFNNMYTIFNISLYCEIKLTRQDIYPGSVGYY